MDIQKPTVPPASDNGTPPREHVSSPDCWTKDVDDIYAAARSLISPTFDFRDHHLNYAKLSIKLKKVGKDRARTRFSPQKLRPYISPYMAAADARTGRLRN